MKSAQNYVKKFNDERDWSHEWSLKDLLLNFVEETGEAWNIIKWLKDEELSKSIKENHDAFEDYVGDMLYLIYKVAYLTGVDSEKAFKRTMKDYEDRFPIGKVKGKHSNILSGGFDGKYDTNKKNDNEKK